MTLEQIDRYLRFFSKMYDRIRLVDPREKRVLEYRNCRPVATDESCYDYWKSGKICENCISVRAYRENKSFIKLEQTPQAIMVVTAMPVQPSETPVVLEMLKNATDTMFLGMGDYNAGQPLSAVVRNLNSMVVKDHLTAVYNRRFLDERLPSEIVRAKLAGQPLTVLFADIDNLKWINDTYGHATGDRILREAAVAMQKSIRSGKDWIARYGGDEFLICLANSGEDLAGHVAERIRTGMAEIQVTDDDPKIRARVSFGIQTVRNELVTAEELVRMADRKMYEAKRRRKTPPKPPAP